MLDMEDIGYFLFMQQQEEQLKVNAENKNDLVGAETTTNGKKENDFLDS